MVTDQQASSLMVNADSRCASNIAVWPGKDCCRYQRRLEAFGTDSSGSPTNLYWQSNSPLQGTCRHRALDPHWNGRPADSCHSLISVDIVSSDSKTFQFRIEFARRLWKERCRGWRGRANSAMVCPSRLLTPKRLRKIPIRLHGMGSPTRGINRAR